jgi:hypothetical protein
MRREGLVELRVGSGAEGSVLIFAENTAGTRPTQQTGTQPEHNRNTLRTQPEPLETIGERTLDSRSGFSGETRSEIDQVVGLMNATLSSMFGIAYRPVNPDQHGSNAALKRLREEGIPLDFILKRLRYDASVFNPDKAGRGELPGSFGFFERRIRAAWARDHGGAGPAANASAEAKAREDRVTPPRRSSAPTKLDAVIERFTSRTAG